MYLGTLVDEMNLGITTNYNLQYNKSVRFFFHDKNITTFTGWKTDVKNVGKMWNQIIPLQGIKNYLASVSFAIKCAGILVHAKKTLEEMKLHVSCSY